MKNPKLPDGEKFLPSKQGKTGFWLSLIAWIAALFLAAVALYVGWQIATGHPVTVSFKPAEALVSLLKREAVNITPTLISPEPTRATEEEQSLALSSLGPAEAVESISRRINLHTIIPERPHLEVVNYTVSKGDSVFEIASSHKIKPETVLWANYDLLNDNPDLISLGMDLKIPPVDGVYYIWQAGDTIQSVAARFEAKPEDILNWPGNNLDLADPKVEPGSWLLVPGGHREFRQWIIPVIPRGRAGVSKTVYGAGACEGGYEGAYGTGSFIWPAGNHTLSGNDYWDGHLGIDIAAGEGAPIYASDSGVVVFAGWANYGYGYTIMLDHGNGYQTLYAHLSNIAVYCGRSVGQGAVIGYAGTTGNSTGPHLHFEVRLNGAFVNPWYVLP